MTEPEPVFRFAPSPNGELHLGHAYSALLNLEMARQTGGKMLLRIEDIDQTRCTPELEHQMLKDLEWIGFEWDEEPLRQSTRFDAYRAALENLDQKGLVYPAVLSRGEARRLVRDFEKTGRQWPCDPDGAPFYPGMERNNSVAEREAIFAGNKPFALRLNIKRALAAWPEQSFWQETGPQKTGSVKAEPKDWGDVILARKDTPASYHLCCVVDDAYQHVTHVVRGLDLFYATGIQRLLQNLLGLTPPLYHHHQLVLDKNNRKLSKSNKDTSLRMLREAGQSPQQIRDMISKNLHLIAG